MSMRLKILSVLAGLLIAGCAAAAQPPNVEYSADSYMETAEFIQSGTVHYAPGKERREYIENGEKMIMIIRHDKKRAWMLMPAEKMYMDMQISGSRKGDLSGYQIDQTRVGEETVNGVRTTKSKIIMTGLKGEKFGGFFWTTKDNIVMKMDAISVDKGSKDRIKSELKNLKIGAQDPSLFEIPSDYSAAGMPGMGGLGGLLGGATGGGDEKREPQPAPKSGEPQGGGGFGLGDMFKKILP